MAPRHFGVWTSALLVVASMVGTGVFTTPGYLIRDLQSVPAVLIAWLVGGVAAAAGALSYGELAAALPSNGGEYRLLSRIYHPSIGVCAAVVSFVAGFSAPIAAAAIAFGTFANEALGIELPPALSACALILLTSLLHAARVDVGKWVQNGLTIIKTGVIVVFIVAGAFAMNPALWFVDTGRPTAEALLSTDFAVSLVFVSFAYTGWNAAAYVAGEVDRPGRNLPLALGLGTLLVTAIYVGLNAVFLAATDAATLAEAGEGAAHTAAVALFGETAGRLLSGMIALGLLSTVGALVITGPRVYEAVGQDYPRLGFLAGRKGSAGPVGATLLQGVCALAMALTESFDTLVTFVGFTLSLFAGLTVLGVFVLRVREPDLPRPYRALLYPVTPIVFLALVAWMCTWSVAGRPVASLWGLVTVVAGLALYFVVRPSPRGKDERSA